MELKIYKSHTFVRLILSIVVIAMLCASASARRKDVVVMKNGDKLTGDVKRLENGVLYVETDYSSGSVPIDWMQVESVHSIAGYQVTLSNGRAVVAHLPYLLLAVLGGVVLRSTSARETNFCEGLAESSVIKIS